MTTKVKKLGPGTRLSSAAPRVLAARLRDVLAQAEGAALLRRESVHQMRVATRRLRVALQVFGAPKSLSRELKKVQDALGEVRDAQVHPRLLSGQLRVRGKRLFQELVALERRTAPRLAAQKLEPPGRLGGHRMRKALRKKLRQIEEQMAADPVDPKGAHALRIAVKKLRYRAELLERALPLKTLLQELEPLQEALGQLHDFDVRASLEPAQDPAERARKALELERVYARWRDEKIARAVRRDLR